MCMSMTILMMTIGDDHLDCKLDEIGGRSDVESDNALSVDACLARIPNGWVLWWVNCRKAVQL